MPRDSRFGQFADPSFGASLNQPQGQGVLPAPQEGTSASAKFSPQPTGYAEGGPIDDQDSGDAQPAEVDPFATVKAALNYGRKSMGLPEQFYGDKGGAQRLQGKAQRAMPQQPGVPEGGAGSPQAGPLREESQEPTDQGQDSGNADEDGPAMYAEGGAVEDDRETKKVIPTKPAPNGGEQPTPKYADGGVIPDEGEGDEPSQGQQGQGDPTAYLQGAGAAHPQMAQQLEQQVDPQGRMDPNQRKLAAVNAAGSPEKAFSILQHYRQKFNAYNSFAQVAAQGASGKPPDIMASAQAATQAYQHLPDGKAVDVKPVQGGVHVRVRPLQDLSGKDLTDALRGHTKRYAEGGSVEDDGEGAIPQDMNYETPSAAPADDEGPVKEALGGAPHEKLRDFVLSIPQYLGWLKKDGQADSVMDKGVESTLETAQAQQAPAPMPGAPPQQGAMNPMNTAGAVAQGNGPGTQAANTTPPAHFPTPRNPQQFGAQVGSSGAQEGASLADIMHDIDQAYPSVGMSRQRAEARMAARQHFMDSRAKVEAEQTKGEHADKRATIGADSRVKVAETNGEVRKDVVGQQQAGAGARNENTVAGRERVANQHETGAQQRFEQGEQGKTLRTVVANKPGIIGNQDKIKGAMDAMPGRQQPQQGQQQGQPQQAPPNAQQRVAGTTYQTPKGPLTWTGTGWLKPAGP